MPEPDLMQERGFKPTILDDTNDVPKFGQVSETVKDALVHELRDFFRKDNITPEERVEVPTVRKYSIGFGPGEDPYATTQKISQEYPDFDERLPHVAVSAISGNNNTLTIGQPFIGHTQLPPRVRGANAEPYALTNVATQVSTVTVTVLVIPFAYTVTVGGTSFTYISVLGDTLERVTSSLRDAMRQVLNTLLRFTQDGAVLTMEASEPGFSFTMAVSANLATATPQAASTATEPDKLVLRTMPDGGRTVVEEEIQFRPARFPSSDPVTAALAVDVIQVIQEQGKYLRARAATLAGPAGPTNGFEIVSGGPVGGIRTPNEVEVLAGSSANAVAVLGLGAFGTGTTGDAVTAGPGDDWTLSVAGATYFTAQVGSYVTMSGLPALSKNLYDNGRRLIVDVPVNGGDTLVFRGRGVAESFDGASWFIGLRDDSRNPERPVMNRRHMSWKLTVQIGVLTESANTRTELGDLLLDRFSFRLEEKFFELLGRGIFDEAYPTETWQISIHSELQHGGEQDVPRPGGDQKDKIYISTATIPVTLFWYIDRVVPATLTASTDLVYDPPNVTERGTDGTLNDFDVDR